MAEKRDPFAEGADARLGGHDESSNPFDPDTEFDAFCLWNDGWASIDADDE